MQEAVDFLEKNRIYFDTLQIEVVPLAVAYKAIEMAIDNQIAEAMEALQSQLGGLIEDLETITSEEND